MELDTPPGRLRVLVVDDEPAILKLVGRALGAHGYETVCATSGSQALQMIDGAPPDLVIADIVMPEMNGVELVKRIAERSPSTASLFISGYSGELQLPAGANVLEKPFSMEELAARVREVLACSAAASAKLNASTSQLRSTIQESQDLREQSRLAREESWKLRKSRKPDK